MANKLLLKQSIDKLKRNNEIILGRLRRMCDPYNTKDEKKIEELNNIIARNNSMILDYEFQLNEK